MTKYIQIKKTIVENVDDSDNEDGDGGKAIDATDYSTRNIDTPNVTESEKVVGYESDFIDSLDPRIYVDTTRG